MSSCDVKNMFDLHLSNTFLICNMLFSYDYLIAKWKVDKHIGFGTLKVRSSQYGFCRQGGLLRMHM